MAALLWLAIGVLVALLTYVLPILAVIGPLVVLALAIVSVLVPRQPTSALAKVAIGFGATYLVLFGPNVLRDPLSAPGAAFLLFGGGLLITLLGVAGAIRARLRRRRVEEAEAAAARI
ncbi:MAG TPA: hypothetical protein VIA02_04825 [Candidatus Limnocylindria bacterium]|jgi:hypothetical protein